MAPAAVPASPFPSVHSWRGFSLVEVVVAVGIFGVGLAGAVAFFAPLARSATGNREAEEAAHVAEAVLARLRALPFDRVAALLQDADALRRHDAAAGYNPNDGAQNPRVLFGKRDGEVGVYLPSGAPRGWYDSAWPKARLIADADKFFEIDLVRDETLSPKAGDANAPMLAFTMRVRWPAFLPSASGPAIQVGANPAGAAITFDHSAKRVLVCAGVLTR